MKKSEIWLLRCCAPVTVVIVAALFLLACSPASDTLRLSGPTMGTTWSVQVVSADQLPKPEQLQDALEQRLEELNEVFSTYLPASQITAFNQQSSSDWFPVSDELVSVVEVARKVSESSNGAFDPTIAPLVNLWGFGPDGQPQRIPEREQIESLLETTGLEKLETRLDPPALRKMHPQLQLDLSAIAKGYAVDELARLLDRLKAHSYMVEVGGEVRTKGPRADGRAWQIALESPVAGTREVLRIVGLQNQSMATSGDYRNFFELDGQRYSHTIDPRNGWPVAHDLAAVNVIADDCMSADAWATALLVLGQQYGPTTAEWRGLAANFLSIEDGAISQRPTARYTQLANQQGQNTDRP